ncbi:hypothetical protein J1N35_028488 [Gossypium stocksii]|uniref:Uncharacterized protein n=1 Tax=Gossypium stocksii TaxID=47602 RepID=A0A9D3ZR59_9ROSI|nr:hypothetical protein J1N35_028488 [Gossypium stocksii]
MIACISLNKPQTRRSLKRKLEQEFEEDKSGRCKAAVVESCRTHQDIIRDVRIHVDVLNTCISFTEAHRAAAKCSAQLLSEIAMNEDIVNLIVECGAVPALVKQIQTPPLLAESDPIPFEYEVEKVCAFALGLIAVKNSYDTLFFIVDLHAITLPYDTQQLSTATRNTAAIYLACGVDTSKASVFVQSHVRAHVELMWLLSSATPIGWLNRMIQFKEKSRKAVHF